MDLVVIDQLISSSFLLSFIAGYIVEKFQGGVMEYVKEKFSPDTIEYQFMDALNEAMCKTCLTFFGEYDDSAISDTFLASLANLKRVKSVSSLEEIFKIAIEQPVDGEVLDAWVENFKTEITKPSRDWLYRFVTFQSVLKDDRIKTANEQYAQVFEEVMFLHKNVDYAISLRDIFVLHNFEVARPETLPSQMPSDILGYIKCFVSSSTNSTYNNDVSDCLFIEGDAGLGKSSLISYFSYLYSYDIAKWLDIFGERELICVRLRDIIPNSMRFSSDSINADVLKYLNIDSLEEFKERHSNAVVILDGFDELCMVEKINENTNFYVYELHDLFQDCKLIITTRPQYLNITGLDILKSHIVLKHFDKMQRKEWVRKYREFCSSKEEEIALDYIKNAEDKDSIGICDTPLALYLLAAGRINEDAKRNHWALYNQIFYKELSETEYNSVFPTKSGTYSHGIKKYSEYLYRVGAEIAYYMYKNGNRKSYLTEEEVQEIVKNTQIQNAEVREIVRRCYALCSYWKMNVEKGAVEFYHNNIRDFFMCEKIFYEMEKLYKECDSMPIQEIPQAIIQRLNSLFRYSEINLKVIEFLYLRVLYQNENLAINNFAKREHKQKYLPLFFKELVDGKISISHELTLGEAYKSLIRVISNTFLVYRLAYEPYLINENELIDWWGKRYKLFPNDSLGHIIKQAFIEKSLIVNNKVIYMLGKANYDNISFEGADLRSADFVKCTMNNANLSNTALQSADFQWSILHGADFSDANLHYTNFRYCDLTECNFTNSYLADATLPDGFSSEDSTKVAEHLQGLGIEGLRI